MTRTASNASFACIVILLPAVGLGDVTPQMTWHCESGSHVREIALYRNEPTAEQPVVGSESRPACRVVYTKNGDAQVLWQARNDPSYCQPRVLALVEKLENGGFRCARKGEPAAGDVGVAEGSVGTKAEPLGPTAAAPVVTNDAGRSALRELLGRYYEDYYLDAMAEAIPAGFTVHPDKPAVSAGPGGLLHLGPPDHFVKTMPDGSYVLVNQLLFEHGGTSSFVNLGFVVDNERYRFLGYATAHSVSEVEVHDADTAQVSLMLTETPAPACEMVRRLQLLAWAPVLETHYAEESKNIPGTGDCAR